MGPAHIFLIAALVAIGQAGPIFQVRSNGGEVCAKKCTENVKFDYRPGFVYEYTYNAQTTNKMNGASENAATMVIDARVEIESVTKCDLVMRIKDVSLQNSGDILLRQDFTEALRRHPLKFSFQDGKIEDICPMNGESTWTLNIKRGILSAFQNSMDNFDQNVNITETDVVGSCLTKYNVEDNNSRIKTVQKSKDLLNCDDREAYRVAMQTIGYNVPSYVKSLPLLKSHYKCQQTMDLSTNTMQKSICSEEHVFRPFSNGKSGAMTSQVQVLSFNNKKRAGRSSNEHINRRTTLLFEHQYGSDKQWNSEDKAVSKLQELCQKASDDVRPELPEMINDLISSMRQVDREALLRIYNKVSTSNFCRLNADRPKKYFLDAIPMVGSIASVQMIQSLISRKHVSGNDAKIWLMSLSFIHHPSKEMVAAITPLLDDRDVSGNTILAVSSLASSYCNVRKDCGNDYEIVNMIKKLVQLIGNCDLRDGDNTKTVHVLRALGNIGHSNEAVSRLSQCLTRNTNPASVRIAAIDAFRRIPCEAMRSDLMGVFRDEMEDAEIRINAYIAVMKCPTTMVLLEVQEMLEKEKSNQVGSFVWSHLTNLMETSDPHMQEIRTILRDEKLSKEFNLDNRKFSRNYEGSFFFETINTGAKVDSNVIFSSKSFIPRSANLNLTIDLFGHAINFLEVGGRVEGLEQILESYTGSNPSTRPSIKPQGLGKLQNAHVDMNMDKFAATAYIRIFGNDLQHWSEKDLKGLLPSFRSLSIMGSTSFNKNMVLVDSRMIVPTCIGIPLNLTVTATGSINLEAKASRNVAEIKPSASIQVKCEMSVDAHVTKSGLKMVSTAHTSTGAELNFDKGNVQLQFPKKKSEFFNLKTDFYTIHGETEKKQELIKDNVKRSKICTGETLKSITGLRVCQEIQFPNASRHTDAPFFPFTGPIVYDLHMINEDVPNGYKIQGKYQPSEISMSVDTPGSKSSRRISLDANLKKHSLLFMAPWRNIKMEGNLVNKNTVKSITAKLSLDNDKEYSFFSKVDIVKGKDMLKLTPSLEIKSPKHQVKAKGNVEYVSRKNLDLDMAISGSMVDPITLKVTSHVTPKQIAATSVLKIGKKEYFMTSRVGKLLKKSGFKYNPYMKVTVLGKDLLELSSEVNYDGSKQMSLDFKLDKVFSKVVSLNALTSLNVGKNKNKYISRIAFKSPVGNFKANGDMEKKKTGLSSRVIASYNFGTKYSDRLTLSSKVRDLSLKNSVRYSGNVELASKRKSAMNFNLKGQLAKASNHLETEFDLLYGNPKNKATNNLKFHSVINRKTKAIAREYNYALSVQHPGKNIDFQVKADHFHTATNPMRKIENNVMVQIAPHNVVKTGFLYSNVKVKGLQNSEVKASLSFLGKDIKIEEKLTQLSKNGYENQVSFQVLEGQLYTVNTIYKSIGKDMTVENTLRFPNKREAKVSTILKISEGDYNAKIQFDADEQTISDKQINYMAESSVKYTMSPKSISCDASLGLMWAPNKKISASVTGTFIKGSTLNTQITFSTPFNSLENFNGQSKQSWTTKRFSSMTVVSWNNNNQIKQDVTLNYPDMELKYTASSVISGKSSNLDIVLMNTDSKKTAKMIVKSDRTTFINLLMAHTKDRRQVIADGSLAFDIFAVKGRLNIGIQCDDREITSSGDGQLAVSYYGVNKIGASYNLKHNSVVSSAEMSYTSSLRSYRNGKISAEITKRLPKNLNGNMQLTHNNRQLFRIDASYGRQNDNFDVSVEIIEPSGKKITTSTNLNLSGARKTSHIEIKSSYIDASVDGAFEFQAGRYFDSELRVESNGRNILMSTTYKKEASSHKLTAKLGLPDNKQIKVEGILNYENPISVSFKVNSPDFPLLTEIDMEFSHESNGRTTVTKTSVKVMPYLEKTQLQARLSRGYITEGSIELDTPFGSMRQAKAVLAFEGDWIKIEKIRFNAELNNNNVFEMIMFYNLNSISDFSVNMVASTSHRRFDEFLVDLKHSGGLTNLDCSLKVKVANEFMFASKIENTHRNTLISTKTELKDFDDWETKFIRKGYLDDMTLTLSHSIGKKDRYKVDITLKDYGTVTSAQLVAPRGIKFNVDINVDIENINFDLESVLKCGSGDSYEFTALYNHLSKLHLKTSMPSYNGEMLMTLSGKLKSFKAQAKLTNNSDRYDMSVSNSDYYRQINAELMTPLLEDSVSFTLSGNLEKFDVKLSAKHSEDIYEMKASNGDYYRVMNFNVNFPQFECDIHFDGNIRNSNGLFKVLVGNVKYEVSFSNKNYYDEIKIAMSIPRHQFKILSDIDLKKSSMNGDLRIIYNKKKFSLNGSYKDMGRKKIVKVDLKTPYFNDNLLATVAGKLRKFNVVFKLQHNKAMYELTASNKDYYRMLDVNVYLPGVKAKLDFEGELKRFKAFTSMTIARDQYKFVVSNQNYLKGVSVELSTPQLGNCELTLDLNGNLNDFNLVSQFTHNKVKYLLNVSRNSKTGVHAITVTAPKVSLSGKLRGSLKTFNFESDFILNNDKYELVISNKNYIQQINARLSTPQTGIQKLTAKISKFNGQILVENNNDMYECIFSFKDNEFTSSLSLPNYRGNVKVKFDGDVKNFNFVMQFVNNGKTYEMSASNNNFMGMKAHIATPHWDDIDIIVDNKGNLKNGQSHVKLSFGEHFLENNAVMQMDQSRFSFGLATSNMVLRKSAKLNMNVEFSYRTKVLKQSFDIDMNGWKASSKSSIDVSRGLVATISIKVPYYDQSELKVNITPLRLDSITATVSLKSVISGDIIVEYEHSLAGGSFTSKGHIEDGSYGRVAGYNMDISFGGDFVYDVQLDWKNSRRNIKSKGMLSFQNRKTVGTFQLQTPFKILTDLSVSGEFEISRGLEFSVTLPKQKYAIDMNWNRKSFDVIINLNMDMQNKNKQYKIVTSYRNADQTAVISRDITVKLVHPFITLTTTSQLKKTSNMILMSGDFSWGQEQGEKIGAELRLQTSNKYEALLKLMTPRRNIEVTSSVQIRRDRYTAMALLSLDAERKSDNIEVHAEIMNYANRKDIDLTIKFPNQKNVRHAFKASVTGREGKSIFSSRSEFSIDQDPRKTLKVESKLTDDNNNYTLELIAEHPQSNLAFNMLAFVAAASDRYNTGMELNYMNYKRQQHNLMVRGQIHKLRRELDFEFEGPSKTIQLSSSVRSGNNHYQISMNKKENGMKDMTATASVNPISRNMHVELNYDQANPDRFLHMDAGVVKNTLMFKTYRTKGQKKISNDSRLSIDLRPSSVLLFQMNWNPALLTELNNYGFATLNSYGMEMKSVGEMIARTVFNEASVKLYLMKTAFSEEFQPMIRYFSTEYESLYRDIARQLVKLSDIYSKNHFYLKTIGNSVGSAWNMMWTNYQYIIEAMNMKIDKFNKVMSDQMDQAKKYRDQLYSQIDSVYQLNKNDISRAIDDVIQYMQDQYNNGYERMILIQQEIRSYINRYPAIIKRVIDQIKEHPYGVMVVDTMLDIYQIFYDQKAAINQHISSLRYYPVVEILSSASNEVYQQALWAYRYWQVKDNILGLKDRISKFVDNEVKLMKKSLSDLGRKTVVFAPERGVIKIEIRFGGVMTAYNHIESSVGTIDDISRSLKKYSDMIPSSNWTIYDVYYMMKPSSDVNNWIPPFKAQATLFGGQHITTFDGRHLDYKGTCSYVLTRDFVDGNFTVVVNYHPDRRHRMIKSITVTTALNEQVDIYSDYKVQFNGRVVRLPLKLADASIYRSGDDIIMAGLRGYRVTCNPKLNLYTVDISGWYFNRVAGLFGSYNNEQSDDMTMSNMKYTNDLEQFAMSWSVSKSCWSHHNFARGQMVPESRECAHMFLEPSSPFRNCFRQVNPDSFYHTCATQSNNAVSNQKVICDVSAYYIKQCQGREVFMQLPVHCGTGLTNNQS